MNSIRLVASALASVVAAFVLAAPFAARADAQKGEEVPVAVWKYAGQINKCFAARAKSQAKTIVPKDEFYCPEGLLRPYEVAYQVILDLKFKGLDKEAEGKLEKMQSAKGKDFVAMDVQTVNWFDSTSPEAEFHKKYTEACSEVLADTVWSFENGITTDGTLAVEFIQKNQGVKCLALANAKLSAYRDASRLFAQKNVAESFKSDKKDFKDRLKKEYDNFLMKWMIYVGQMARIKDKWNEKTPNHSK